jgi:hypothetical protein
MRFSEKNLIIFPEYEDVFYDDIENHKKYFLPICSLNLKVLGETTDKWVHFISVKELYQGCVGEKKSAYYTQYTKADMLGFDVIDGKYKFDADWKFFSGNNPKEFEKNFYPDLNKLKEQLFQVRKGLNFGGLSDEELMQDAEKALEKMPKNLADVYALNQKSYDTMKAYYMRNKEIYPFAIESKHVDVEYYEKIVKSYKGKSVLKFPEFGKVLTDIQFQSKGFKSILKGSKKSVEALHRFEDSNLSEKPFDTKGKIMEYIGSLKGYYFQRFSADNLILFYDDKIKKAVICFEHT